MSNLISFGSGSKGNCHLININDTKIMLDAGVSLKKMSTKISRRNLAMIDAVLLTHSHL